MHEYNGKPNTKSAVHGTWAVVGGKQEGFLPVLPPGRSTILVRCGFAASDGYVGGGSGRR